jgi:hypothetical protein
LQKGAALVITAQKKTPQAPTVEPVHYSALIEEIAEPAVPSAIPVIDAVPEVMDQHLELAFPPAAPAYQEPEPTFGPTTWERVDEIEAPVEFTEPQRETRSIEPEVWDLPSQAPPQPAPAKLSPEENRVPNSDWAEERFVATGFLGLEDYVEDEEEILKAKRPWWKRIFGS